MLTYGALSLLLHTVNTFRQQSNSVVNAAITNTGRPPTIDCLDRLQPSLHFPNELPPAGDHTAILAPHECPESDDSAASI
jgi:hypothetical protein